MTKIPKAILVKAGETTFFAETDESIKVPYAESLPGVPEGMQPTVGTEQITQEFKAVRNVRLNYFKDFHENYSGVVL